MSKTELEDEIKIVEEQLKAQGTTVDDLLKSRNMTDKDFREQITFQKKLEKMFADKITVSDDEIKQYMKDNSAALPKGVDSDTLKSQVAESIKQDKFNKVVGQLIDTMRAEANIKYFVSY